MSAAFILFIAILASFVLFIALLKTSLSETLVSNVMCQTDFDECANRSLNDCARKEVAICHNTHGSYVCQCKDGYNGNGQICEGKRSSIRTTVISR